MSRFGFILCLVLAMASEHAVACELKIDGVQVEAISLQSAQGELTKRLFDSTAETTTESLDGQALVDAIDCYLGSKEKLFYQAKEVRDSLNKRGSALHAAQSKLEQSMHLEGINASVNRDAGTGFVILPNKKGNKTEISLYDDILAKNCRDEASQKCTQAFNFAASLWWIAGQYRRLANNFNQDAKQQSLVFNQRLDSKWRSYKDDTIELWPQEVLLNSVVYSPSKRGLSAPPSYKLLALRPSLGLTYLSDQSHHIQPTINIDLLGVYWWRYSDAGAGPGRGVSATLVWDGDDTAYGLSYHHNPKWSATLAKGDDNDTVISISFQFAYWLLKR